MDEKFFYIGQTVWVITTWGTIDECIINSEQNCDNYYSLKVKSGGNYYQLPKNIFSSYREAILEKAKRSKEKKEKYKFEINNLKDLFEFMLSNMQGHETSDYEAVYASKERILELTGIDLDKED